MWRLPGLFGLGIKSPTIPRHCGYDAEIKTCSTPLPKTQTLSKETPPTPPPPPPPARYMYFQRYGILVTLYKPQYCWDMEYWWPPVFMKWSGGSRPSNGRYRLVFRFSWRQWDGDVVSKIWRLHGETSIWVMAPGKEESVVYKASF